jgi:hypothetical protein
MFGALRRLPALGVIGLALSGLAGCGSTTTAKGRYVARGDAICADQKRQVRAIPPPNFDPATATPAQAKSATAFLDRTLELSRDHLKQLRALPDPKQDKALVQRTYAAEDEVLKAVDDARRSAGRGDPAGLRAALIRAQTLSTKADGLARQFGFRVCGTSA